MGGFRVVMGDCLEVLPILEAGSVDAVVTDPPYGLSFMGKDWDHGVPGKHFWEEVLRVAKPGAHLLAFGGTRTYHRLACGIEDAGWEIRDCVMWVYGSGFPKSLDVSKAIDKAAGAEREVLGVSSVTRERRNAGSEKYGGGNGIPQSINLVTAPATDAARQWSGWGTALKPAWEPIIVARKPLVGTVAENVLRHGTGALNIGGCRVGTEDTRSPSYRMTSKGKQGGGFGNGMDYTRDGSLAGSECGRWPANVIHDGSDEVVGLFPGDAARFFYCAKASKADRDEGCEGLDEIACGIMEDDNYDIKTGSGNSRDTKRRNHHPTVKPTSLMRYLCRLVTPPGGLVLDPFAGSGSTGRASVLEGFRFLGIEKEAEYVEIARLRLEAITGHCGSEPFKDSKAKNPRREQHYRLFSPEDFQ